jgi:hypothetical protein
VVFLNYDQCVFCFAYIKTYDKKMNLGWAKYEMGSGNS